MNQLPVIPVCRKEFGLKLLTHVPQAHTLCLRGPHVVEIEAGEEALYPAAEEWIIRERGDDSDRYGSPQSLGVEPTRFVPEPYVRQGVGAVDVVICPRWRAYGSEKNWTGWAELAERLDGAGLDVFAAGAPDSSADVPCPRAWDYTRFLDASIEAIRKASLVIATDAGLAHLAVLCGAPLLVITYRGRVAPGPVITSSGRKVRDEYWRAGEHPKKGGDRFQEANHTGSTIRRVNGWESVERVAAKACRMVGVEEPWAA